VLPRSFDESYQRVSQLVANFQRNERHYLSPTYSESQARLDFIDKFWVSLGWDVEHAVQTNPYEQEVKVEKNVSDRKGEYNRRKRADYAFLAPNFRDVRFYVEAKKPSVDVDNADDYFQTIRYGWNSQTPLAVLTDFQQFRVLDCRYKPDLGTALQRAARKYQYTEYLDREKFAEIYHLFSREAVTNGSLEKFAETYLAKAAGRAVQRGLFRKGYQSIDESFLQELDEYREQLARAFKNENPQLGSAELTEATQRTLDRLIFMRFLEDKSIEAEPLVEPLLETGAAWQEFVATSKRLDKLYNGIIFKKHALLDAPDFQPDSQAFEDICERLGHTKSPYDFNAIPIHILGSIYERFLGKTIIATASRARVEEKPEVRKAGGVYYTPEYIVRYIVENTVGKLIQGKTPDAVRKMRFADISCGSGSFLLGVYDLLLRYLTHWYNRSKANREKGRRAGCIEDEDGRLRLSLRQKSGVLLDNIYGVDVDPQAVEVAQLSLYLKLLEDETPASARNYQQSFKAALLPSLSQNIVCGNSLIGHDVIGGNLFGREEERKLSPMSFEDAFPDVMRSGGFDAIVSNPPYVRIQTMQETSPLAVDYYRRRYKTASKGNYDIYVIFVERALGLLNSGGQLGYILPHKFFNAKYGESLRRLLANGKHLSQVVHFGDQQVFEGATTYTCLLFLNKAATKEFHFTAASSLSAWRTGSASRTGVIPASKVTPGEWNFNIGEGAAVFEKLSQMPIRLGNVAGRMAQGLRTSANEIYVLDVVAVKADEITAFSKQLQRQVRIEREAVLSFLQGREIKPYQITPSGKVVIVPYQVNGGGSALIPKSDYSNKFPLTFSYLLENKACLQGRESGKMRGSNWYGYVYPKNLELMRSAKILVPDIADRASFALDEQGQYAFTSGYGITLKSSVAESAKYILGLLNSRVLDFYLKRVSTTMRGGFFRYFTQFIEQLPIRTINWRVSSERACHDRMVEMVEHMIDAKKMLASSLTDRDRSYYEHKCLTLDSQIDRLVYELYELTSEEIKVVERG
jgi:hypothetical protein